MLANYNVCYLLRIMIDCMCIDRHLTEGWQQEKNTKRKVVWTTNQPKLVAALASFNTLRGFYGFQGAKGYKPRSAKQVRSLLILSPPAWLTWSIGADGSQSSHLFANMMILNRHGRLTLTEAHPSKGRQVRAFEGYSGRAEEKLLTFAKRQLRGMVEVRGRKNFDPGLLRAMDSNSGISLVKDEAEMEAAGAELAQEEEAEAPETP